MPKVLVVDDKGPDREELSDWLRRAHFDVGQASSPDEALGKFESFAPDVAVIDYRCRNSEPSDDGGVYVATRGDPRVPKIMISGLAERSELKKAIGTSHGAPIATHFLDKQEIRGSQGEALVRAVRDAMELRIKWLRDAQASVPAELAKQHESVRRMMVWHTAGVIGTGLMLAAVLVYHLLHPNTSGFMAVVVVGAAVVAELLLLLLVHRAEPVLTMARQHNADIAERAKYEVLLLSCDRLESEAVRDEMRKTLIVNAAGAWLKHQSEGGS